MDSNLFQLQCLKDDFNTNKPKLLRIILK